MYPQVVDAQRAGTTTRLASSRRSKKQRLSTHRIDLRIVVRTEDQGVQPGVGE
jgi:hypothetical protein